MEGRNGRSSESVSKIPGFLLALALLFPFPSPLIVTASPSSSLVINELMYDPAGSELDGEWVELFNVGGALNIDNWTLSDQDGNSFNFPSLEVPIHGFLLVYMNCGNTTQASDLTTVHMNRTFSMLNNDGDDVLLTDGQGNAVDYISYGSGSGPDPPPPGLLWTGSNKTAREGLALALMVDGEDLDSDENWLETMPSPGSSNALDRSQGLLMTEVYYNARRDDEFIRVVNPTDAPVELSGWSLTDLDGSIYFPAGTRLDAGAGLTIAENSTSYCEDTLIQADFSISSGDAPPMLVTGVFKLRNDGDALLLKNGAGDVVDAFCYGDSQYPGDGWSGACAEALFKGRISKRALPDGRYIDTNSSADWTGFREYVIGQSAIPLETFEGTMDITAFSAPDASFDTVANAIDGADESMVLALYELSSFEIAEHLMDALDRGVTLELLLEGSPVEGLGDEERYVMSELAGKGASISLIMQNQSGDGYKRYNYMHAKYAVIDERTCIVGSENWGHNGLPGSNTYGNRGWFVTAESEALAAYLLGVFREDNDSRRRDIIRYAPGDFPVSPNYSPASEERIGSYVPRFEVLKTTSETTIVPVLSPDTSLDEGTVLGMLRSAEKTLVVEQFYIVSEWSKGVSNPFLEELIEAARRGVEVKALLDGSDYNVEPDSFDNDDVALFLNAVARSEGLPLEAKVINLSSHGLLKLHNKGLVADGRRTLVSSINWNRNSIASNRELGLIIDSSEVGEYYSRIFHHDWADDVTPPIAIGCEDLRVRVGEKASFDASGSFDAGSLTFAWDFDGDGVVDSFEARSTFAYNSSGTYVARLDVSDASGNLNASSCTIEVLDRAGTGSVPDLWTIVFYGGLVVSALFVLCHIRKVSGAKRPRDEQNNNNG